MVFEPSIRQPLAATPVDAGIWIIAIEESLACGVGRADGIEEGSELRVGDGKPVDLKAGRESRWEGRSSAGPVSLPIVNSPAGIETICAAARRAPRSMRRLNTAKCPALIPSIPPSLAALISLLQSMVTSIGPLMSSMSITPLLRSRAVVARSLSQAFIDAPFRVRSPLCP